MEDLKQMAKAAKRRLKSNFWTDCKRRLASDASEAELSGKNVRHVKNCLKDKVKSEIKGEPRDEFYEKVKAILDEYGEVSDAIGRLTDKKLYDTLSYEEKQRYNLQLSANYLVALKRYKKEKEMGIS